jgi:hypothetical protein
MDSIAVRWESLGLVAGALVLAVWALRDAVRDDEPPRPVSSGDELVFEVQRPGLEPALVRAKSPVLMGRDVTCAVVVADAAVSRQHARVRLDNGKAVIEDLQSTNGTSVNGSPIAEPTVLRPGDRIGLSGNIIWFLGIEPRAESGERA